MAPRPIPRQNARVLRLALALPLTLALSVPAAASTPRAPAGTTTAAPPWEGEPFSGDVAAMARAAADLPSGGGPAEILLEEGTYRFDARGTATFVYRLVTRPLNADGVRALGRIEHGWSPWRQERPEVRARVIAPDGSVAELDPRTLGEQGEGVGQVDRYTDRRVLVGPLPGVRVGSVIEEVITVRGTAPSFEGGEVVRFWFGQVAPARLVRLRVEAPAELPLRWVVRGPRLKPAERTTGGVRTVVFEQRDVPLARRPEPAAPLDVPPAPYVAFGWGRSWADVAGRYGAMVERQLEGSDLAAPLAEALGAGPRPSREEAVRRIVAWLHARVRYTGLELGEAAIVPARPTDTLARRFGDCKDLSALLAGMLRQAGFPASVVLLSTDWPEIDPELPGLGELDHAVLRVDGGPAIWIDATDPWTPPGRLPPSIQDRLALVTGPGTKDLVRTPVTTSADNTALTVRELHLAQIGRGRIVETRTLTGALSDGERRFRERAGPDIDERYAREVFRSSAYLGSEVKGAVGDGPLTVRVEADESGAVVTQDDEADVPVTPDAIFQPVLSLFPRGEDGSEPPDRTQDLVLPLAYRWEVRYRIFVPEGFRPRALPQGATERFGPASYVQRYALEKDGTVTASFTFDTGARRIPAAEATRLARRAAEVSGGGRGPRVQLERTAAALLASGQVTEALAELARLRAAQPRDPAHPLHLAVTLLELGFGDAAAAAAREGIALDARRGWAHRVYGFVLEHDAVGRLHGPGFDRDGALSEYRRAKELDPGHADGRAALAELYATAPDGQRHGQGADLGAAIDEYRSMREDTGVKEHDGGLLAALISAGRLGEAVDLGREMPAGSERNAMLVAAVAARDGPERAAQEAEGMGEGRREALRGSAPWLVRLRKFPAAAAVLREAARGASSSAELRAQADDFASVRPWEKVKEEGDEAARLLKRLFVVAVTAKDPDKELRPLLSPRVLASDLGDVLQASPPMPVAVARQAQRGTGIPGDALLDVVLSRLEISREGDLARVLRARLRFPFSAAERGSTAYLVREGGQPRLLATDLAWPVLADEALRRLASGDVATAASLVTWAREDAGPDPDPASPGAVLAPLWRPGGGEPDAAATRRAATALLAFADRKGRTLAPLAEARAAATDGPERRALSLALLRAARSAEKPEVALATADEILAADPTVRPAFAAKAWALQRLGRREELVRAGAAAEARLPGDPDVLSALGGSQLLAGDLEGASRTFRKLIDSGQATPLAYNNAAWLQLFLVPGAGRPGDVALDWARRAVDQERDRNHASLNTLAAVYAALDRPAEAREILLRSVADGRPLMGADWYVVGRTAEGWSLADAARAAYARVQPQPVDGAPDPTDARLLADRRLATLGKAAAPTPAAK